jgi:xanthine dehydrogenase YagR molybdenum-binding subunit
LSATYEAQVRIDGDLRDLVPFNADAPEITIEFVEVEDRGIDPLGVKGVGEIGQVGSAAAIANAVFNETRKRIRELPIAAELVMDTVPVPS